ncbi:hypothetical protein FTUN_6871 [Frigoriglobus tundricola]|uniref:Uncharacterized protein n=1 Tax=Frigoriglobus tundricola TaxID=2774151 RepID=A0A6M5YZ12_9BACT|nr:hypothetical protein FTUN_6871 [Frigoriglobus tundricola]
MPQGPLMRPAPVSGPGSADGRRCAGLRPHGRSYQKNYE